MRFYLSPILCVTVRHSYTLKSGAIYWQRKKPKHLMHRYTNSAPLKQNLHTSDPAVAAKKIAQLDAAVEAQWRLMEADPDFVPTSVRHRGAAALKACGILDPRAPCPDALDAFIARLQDKRGAYAEAHHDPEWAYYDAPSSAYLAPEEVAAVKLLNGRDLFLFSDAIEVYLTEHQNAGGPGFAKMSQFTRTCCENFMKLVGDRELTAYTRDDAKAYRDSLMGRLKTESVKRNMTPVAAVFRRAHMEKSLPLPTIWEEVTIPGFGKDRTPRVSAAQADIDRLRAACYAADDDIRWLVGLQVDLCTRISEVAGLRVEDLRPDASPVPYVEFAPNAARSLKGETRGSIASRRRVPLVGAALWAAQRIRDTAAPGQQYAFPRYLGKDGTIKGGSASAAVAKWMRSIGLVGADGKTLTSHNFRHTMRDRLRNANAPRWVQDEVGGWARASVGAGYGEGTALKQLHGFMVAALDAAKA
ncbi:MAG: tyrosine-type recombinase/integrase [Betaproteobacteria bacterium]|nr:tyrosine-type recombinase/integrase [Betaproteobacteria bacterium]MCL2887366.1 tyrosine-type recombinase/integrase [Betaproteobacteria bacterium]